MLAYLDYFRANKHCWPNTKMHNEDFKTRNFNILQVKTGFFKVCKVLRNRIMIYNTTFVRKQPKRPKGKNHKF